MTKELNLKYALRNGKTIGGKESWELSIKLDIINSDIRGANWWTMKRWDTKPTEEKLKDTLDTIKRTLLFTVNELPKHQVNKIEYFQKIKKTRRRGN